MTKPSFFEKIRTDAARRWDQLEADPELAGPWHQLFKQVQSPRHVISELLQNADDASATEAHVRIDGDVFIFEHNGEDFKAEHFASLCRFGYSNKRALHTIGFRGIGFKSTFSIGDRVELDTPTLSVDFYRKRFTEPVWAGRGLRTEGRTSLRVTIKDAPRRRELEKNMSEWLKSGLSLLFFRKIRRLVIGSQAIEWRQLSQGPVKGSAWMAQKGSEQAPLLVVRSEDEPFPDECLAEIRQERMLTKEEDSDFPPARIEMVVGAGGQLFVVLPTGVQTKLPLACNAPFIQDPARLKIKDPEISPTNRWLLERAGRLALHTLLAWLRADTEIADRVRAYDLWPDVDRDDATLEGLCSATVELAFAGAIRDADKVFLTEAGDLTEKRCLVLPAEVHEVWPGDQAARIFDSSGRPALSSQVSPENRRKLLNWDYADEIDLDKVIETLRSTRPPKPKTWRHVLRLWNYLNEGLSWYFPTVPPKTLNILPVQSGETLRSANEVVRLGEKRLLASDKDWEFLDQHLVVLNTGWLRFLADERLQGERASDDVRMDAASDAQEILFRLDLGETSPAGPVIDRVAAGLFAQPKVQLKDCIRLAQIGAKLGVQAASAFRFVTRDCSIRPLSAKVMFDDDGWLEGMLPEAMRNARLLHPDYTSTYSSCTEGEWRDWIASGKSGLSRLVPLVSTETGLWSRPKLEIELQRRGLAGKPELPFKTEKFLIKDWDFPPEVWSWWSEKALRNPAVWAQIGQKLLDQPPAYWQEGKSAEIVQESTTGSRRRITQERLTPSWAMKLSGVPCLKDTRGTARQPGELLRRTEATEPYLDVEPFIPGAVDRESNTWLFDVIGVRIEPPGPKQILERLRALAKASNPPVAEIDKWYRRLDQILEMASSSDAEMIRRAFGSEALTLSEDGGWSTAAGVYQHADEEQVPGASLVRTSVQDLSLWRRVGVPERPTAEHAVSWLKTLSSGATLDQDALRRAKALTRRFPLRVWDECGHWLNLAGQWVPTTQLTMTLTMQVLIPWSHLHQGIKQVTADLQSLPVDLLSTKPFCDLVPLGSKIEERPSLSATEDGQQREWTRVFGEELSRLAGDDAESLRIREMSERLRHTQWVTTGNLQVVPYIDGTPAGSPRNTEVLWRGTVLYSERLTRARLAKRIPEELGKAFDRADIKAALDYAFERTAEEVRSYLNENFKLGEGPVACQAGDQSDSQSDSRSAQSVEDEPGREVTDDESVQVSTQPVPPQQPGRHSTHVRVHKPELMERFAARLGYKRSGNGALVHPSGTAIKRAEGVFPWQRLAKDGSLVTYYWATEHCLERSPLQLVAEVWNSIVTKPEHHSLVLLGTDGNPVELKGTVLRGWVDMQRLLLYPSSYRIALSKEHD